MEQEKQQQEEQQDFKTLTELFQWMKAKDIPQDSPAWHMNYGKFMSMKARKTDTPEFGVFELTPRCNLDCQMCYVHLTKEQMGESKELTFEQIKNLINQAMSLGMMSVQLTGGEAMLHPDFDKIFMYCREKGLRSSVLTNGLLLTDERIQFFKKNNPASLQITLYGWNDESYERVTGHKVFEKVKENILKAKDIGCRLSISATPSKYCNAQDIKKLMQFCQDNELKLRVNSDLQMPYEETGRVLDDFNLTEEEFFAVRRMMKSDWEAGTKEGLPEPGKKEERVYGTKCAAGRAMFCLTWKGELKPCLDLEVVADPFKEGFKKAWEEINNGIKNFAVPSECTECAYSMLCNQCPALHAQGASTGHADRRICARTKRMVEEGLLDLPEGAVK